MKLKYLGTGASEGMPALFCNCPVCARSAIEGGKSLRMRSCALLGQETLIDLSPDIYAQRLRFGLRLDRVKRVIFTHSHPDHLDLYALQLWAKPSCTIHPGRANEDMVLDVYGEKWVLARIEEALDEGGVVRERLRLHEIKHFTPFAVGGYTFHPLRANHRPSKVEDCMIHAITDGQSAVLYANDTGELAMENDAYIKAAGLKFALVSMDCARGLLPGDGHMGFKECLALRERLKAIGAADDNTRFILNHLSHMNDMTHSEWEDYAKGYRIDIAWDGLEVEC